jgi:hypothetical protein
MRIRLGHSTLGSRQLKSWVVEGSLDGMSWTVIDRQTDSQDFQPSGVVSLAILTPAKSRFVRLTKTDERHHFFSRAGLVRRWLLRGAFRVNAVSALLDTGSTILWEFYCFHCPPTPVGRSHSLPASSLCPFQNLHLASASPGL